jgi:hypothetical protein
MQNKKTQTEFTWTVKLDKNLQHPAKLEALKQGLEIRMLVSQAVIEYLKRGEN